VYRYRRFRSVSTTLRSAGALLAVEEPEYKKFNAHWALVNPSPCSRAATP
jgi:hypothetical protein